MVERPTVLSVANCATRVPSRNQRMTRIACLKQLNARVPVRVPRRWRSACSRLETNSTVSSRTVNVAVYVTLIRRRTPMKLDCERTTFIPGFCVFPLHHNRFRVSQPPRLMPTYRPEAVTRKGSIFERLGDHSSVARTYHQLGVLAQSRGEY